MKNFTSLDQIRSAIAANQLTCYDLVQHYLGNIQSRNKALNAFIEVYEDEALERAQLIDRKIKQGEAGKLAGLVIGLKDVICYEDHPLQASSKILDGFVSQFSATVVDRLLAEDAIIIGRQNCDEFAMGSSNENSYYGTVKNAVNTDYVPGGSSGGSAVSVQADFCQISLGSDTGGSVRQPAAFCGVIGLKPTYSRISRYGLSAYASSFDCIGIIGKSVSDIALVLEIIAGKDDFDSTVSHQSVPVYSEYLQKPQQAKIAYIKETLNSPGLDAEVREKTLEKIKFLKTEGYQVEEVEFPLLDYILPTYYILTTAEASSNLSRYDGIRYGYRSDNHTDLESLYKNTRSEGFGDEVKRRIMLGTFVLSADYYDAYYTKAQKVRRLVKEATDKIFETFDFIVLPTTPSPAFKFNAFEKDPIQLYLADLFTVHANVAGIPAISIANGHSKEGLPIGFQIMTKAFEESRLLAFADYLQNNS